MARGKPLKVRSFVKVNGEYVNYDTLTEKQKDEFATRISRTFLEALYYGRATVKAVEE